MPTPTTTYHSPGPGNVWIPGTHGTGQQGITGILQTKYTRNPESFNLNSYAEIVPGVPRVGQWVEFNAEDGVRVVNTHDYIWPDGNDRPQGDARRLRWHNYNTTRFDYPFQLGQITIENAAYDAVADNLDVEGLRAMTARTLRAITVMTTSGNWTASQYSATLDALGVTGGSWVASAVTELFIRKSFRTVVLNIAQATGGAISPERGEIGVVISPSIAMQMGETAEVREYVVNHERALDALQFRGMFEQYGLPRRMYGVEIMIEDAVRNSDRQGGAGTNAFMLGNQAVFVSRPGGIRNAQGAPISRIVSRDVSNTPSLATISVLVAEDMTTETFPDNKNRRTEGHVVDDFDVQVTADLSGYLIADVTT